MHWLETDPMDQRLRFIRDDQSDLHDRTERCARYGISRKTGYKWLARYEADGRISTSGGCAWASSISASIPGVRRRTGRMNGCIAR